MEQYTEYETRDHFTEVVPDQTLHGSDSTTFLRETTFGTKELVSPSSIDDGGQVLPFTRSPNESFSRLVEGTMSQRISSKIEKSLPGDTHRDLRYEYASSYEFVRIYLPFWYFVWDYRGESYGALVDGRQETRVDERLPKDEELQRNANGNLGPLWIAVGIGFIVCVLAASLGALSGIAPWLYAATAIAVSITGIVSLRRRHLILSDAISRRTEAVAQVLYPELENPQDSEQRDEQESSK